MMHVSGGILSSSTQMHRHLCYAPSIVGSTAYSFASRLPKHQPNRVVDPNYTYRDHANEYDSYQAVFDVYSCQDSTSLLFPMRLHKMLKCIEENDQTSVVSWQPHGRCFIIHDNVKFQELLPQFFILTKLASFHRQLNLYGFQRITKGRDRGAYYNEWFLRGKPFLALYISRQNVRGRRDSIRSSSNEEPDFWMMPWVMVSPKAMDIRADLNDSSGRRLVSIHNLSPTTMIGDMLKIDTSVSTSSISSLSSSSLSTKSEEPREGFDWYSETNSCVAKRGKKFGDTQEQSKTRNKIDTPCVIEERQFFPVNIDEDDDCGQSFIDVEPIDEWDRYEFPMLDRNDGLADLANVCAARLDSLLSKNFA